MQGRGRERQNFIEVSLQGEGRVITYKLKVLLFATVLGLKISPCCRLPKVTSCCTTVQRNVTWVEFQKSFTNHWHWPVMLGSFLFLAVTLDKLYNTRRLSLTLWSMTPNTTASSSRAMPAITTMNHSSRTTGWPPWPPSARSPPPSPPPGGVKLGGSGGNLNTC